MLRLQAEVSNLYLLQMESHHVVVLLGRWVSHIYVYLSGYEDDHVGTVLSWKIMFIFISIDIGNNMIVYIHQLLRIYAVYGRSWRPACRTYLASALEAADAGSWPLA